MKKLKIIVTAIMMFGLSQAVVQAQQTLATTGLDSSSEYGSVSYTIGQIDYISSGVSISVTQGVQQAFEKLEVEINSTTNITIWPNPVSDMLNIKITDDTGTGLECWIYSMDGKLLERKKTYSNFLNISLANFAPAAYVLVVTHLSQKANTFKIIKF